jgi:hypothetical protein
MQESKIMLNSSFHTDDHEEECKDKLCICSRGRSSTVETDLSVHDQETAVSQSTTLSRDDFQAHQLFEEDLRMVLSQELFLDDKVTEKKPVLVMQPPSRNLTAKLDAIPKVGPLKLAT